MLPWTGHKTGRGGGAIETSLTHDPPMPDAVTEKKKYGCLMALLPEATSSEILGWVKRTVPDRHLTEAGREDHVHVTVKYGFEDATADEIRGMLRGVRPFPLRIKNIDLFRGNDDGDVLIARVDGRELRDLNRLCSESFSCHDKYPRYEPHLTLAYLNPRFSSSYTSTLPPFVNRTVWIDRLEYSTATREKSVIQLGSPDGKALSYLAETSGGALLLAPRFRSRKQIKYKYRVKSSPFLAPPPAMVESHAGEKSLPNAHTKEHQVGVPFRGNSGRWFVRRQSDGRVVPAKAPGGQTASPKTTPAQPEEHGDTPASKQPEATTSKKPAASRPTTKKPATPKPAPKPKKEKITPENAKQKIAEYVARGNLTPEDSRDFAQYLLGLTVVQLKGLEKELGIKTKGRKAEQAARIAERALQGVKAPEKPAEQPPAEKPVQPEGEPKEEPTGNWAEDVIRKLSAIPPARSSRDVSAFDEANKVARQLQADPDGAGKLRELGLPPVADPATVAEYLMARAKQDEYTAKYVQDKAVREFTSQAFSRPGGAKVDVTQPKFASKQEAVTSVSGQVSSGLKDSNVGWLKARSYSKSVNAVMQRLPDTAARRAAHHLKSFRFAAKQDQVGRLAYGTMLEATKNPGRERDLLVGDYRKHLEGSGESPADWEARLNDPATERAAMDEARAWCWSAIEPFVDRVGGGFSGSGGMYLDGGMDDTTHKGPDRFAMTKGDSQTGVYAHEMAHAIDGPAHEYSTSPLWEHAWNEEINRGEQLDQTLTSYASTVNYEGFAEFGRLLYGGSVDLKDVEQRFPKCSQFFKDNDLWPTK